MINLLKHIFKIKRIAIYTAIFGDYDQLKIFKKAPSGCDYYCFTDNKNLKSDIFKIIHCDALDLDSTRNAKIFKILPHRYFPNYEYSLWIDGSVMIKDYNFYKLVDRYLKDYDIALFNHPERNCVYDELDACIKLKKDNALVMSKQINRYREMGYPDCNGLAACTIILRRHNSPRLIQMNESWWHEIEVGSRRDQLSFNYVAWKHKIKYGLIDGILWDNKYFKVTPHRNKKNG